MNDKITLIITTYNSQEYFQTLWDSIPFHKIDKVIVVNGGEKYTKDYTLDDDKLIWVQHETRKNIGSARNDGLRIAQQIGHEHIFLLEDDLIILNENIFDEYIKAARVTGIKYFCFASYAWEAGPVGARTPRIQVDYNGTVISFYKNTANEFTYRTLTVLNNVGFYREDMISLFDIEWIYRICKTDYCSDFWFFPELRNADDLIKNNPVAISRIDPNGNRWETLQNDYKIFFDQHGILVPNIPVVSQDTFLDKLRKIKQHIYN